MVDKTVLTSLYVQSSMLADVREMYFEVTLFYNGAEQILPVYLQTTFNRNEFSQSPFVHIKGTLVTEVRPFKIYMQHAAVVNITAGEYWEQFVVNYLFKYGAAFMVSSYPEGLIIGSCLKNHYVWFDIAPDKRTINKIEFGRYMPLTGNNVFRESSWAKAVFVNQSNCPVRFMQTSFYSEAGKNYTCCYNEEGQQRVSQFLDILFLHGWQERDYRLGTSNFYKTCASIKTGALSAQWSFTLLNSAEQDIPFWGDIIAQKFRIFWADAWLNNYRRFIDETNVLPVMKD